jgi:hypothetical protein
MDTEEEIYNVLPENLDFVLKTLVEGSFEIDPTGFVPMEEIKVEFKTTFPLQEGTHHAFTPTTLKAFLHSIGNKATDRAIADLVKRDIVEMSHDGTDFCFKLKDDHK